MKEKNGERGGGRDNAPSSEIAQLTDRHASQVGTHAEHEPLRFLDTTITGLRVTHGLPVDVAHLVNLILRAMVDKDRLVTPQI